jgi:superfamily I DNA and RNA helicase
MGSSFFFLQADTNQSNRWFLKNLEKYAESQNVQVYVTNKPLGDNRYSYDFADGLLVMIPKHKIMILNFDSVDNDFDEFSEDIIEDLGSISDKYNYKTVLGRARRWREEIVHISEQTLLGQQFDIEEFLLEHKLTSPHLQKKSELLISLVTGSINDIGRVKDSLPENVLDKIKQKIQLFDGDQTRFIYQKNENKTVTIQGLSGTGKTELLLHKLKDIYLNEKDSKILFTCHNKILADSLRHRIPDFFNFMKVEEQIKWNERLWCVHAWGSQAEPHSGAYRFICKKYGLPFHRYSYVMPFNKACKLAIEGLIELGKITDFAFDYALIDESQDFPSEFFELVKMVTKKNVYIAGDIFQSIFDENIVSEVKPNFLLSKCYRTDPRTLMFAHALGMGLFEEKKLRWLADKEWIACGYLLEKTRDSLILKREPLRRFEDLGGADLQSIEIVKTNPEIQANSPEYSVVNIIKSIIDANDTVTPDDIGIVFLGGNKAGFRLGDILEHLVKKEFGWELNKAIESKERLNNTIFFSNKNNVKGLEFPFVICVSNHISNAAHERNAIYMLLTRSFIKSYLLVQEGLDDKKLASIEKGLAHIKAHSSMQVCLPTAEEVKAIKTNIDFEGNKESLFEIVEAVFDELHVPPLWRDVLFNLIKTIDGDKVDYEFIKDLVETNLEKLAMSRG